MQVRWKGDRVARTNQMAINQVGLNGWPSGAAH